MTTTWHIKWFSPVIIVWTERRWAGGNIKKFVGPLICQPERDGYSGIGIVLITSILPLGSSTFLSIHIMEESKKDQYLVDSSSLFGSTNLDDSSIRTELQLDQNKDVRPSRSHRSIRLLAFILLCIVVPVALYFALRRDHGNVYSALHLSGLVPVMIIIHRTIFEHNMDILGVLILAEFVASMVVLLLPGKSEQQAIKKSRPRQRVAMVVGPSHLISSLIFLFVYFFRGCIGSHGSQSMASHCKCHCAVADYDSK